MPHRSKAPLGRIVQSLLAAGLCTLAATAQQSATATPDAAAQQTPATATPPSDAPAAAPDAKPVDASAAPTPAADAPNNGVSTPEEVKPDPASAGSDAAQTPATTQGDPAKTEQNTGETKPADSATPSQPASNFPTAVAVDAAKAPAMGNLAQAEDQQTPQSPDTPAPSPAPAQETPATPATPPADASAQTPPATAPQQNAPATPDSSAPAAPPATDSAAPQNAPATPAPAAPSDSSAPSAPPATNPSAAPPPTPSAAPAPAAPDSSAPQSGAPSTPPPPASSDTPAVPQDQQPANPAPAPNTDAAPSSSEPPQTPAPAENAAVNPSLPAQQVNEPEPPPASRVDIFAGYAYLRPTGTVGTWSFPSNNTRGYIASGTYYFTRHFGVQAEFSHSEYPLGTTGTSPAPPFVQLGGVTDSFYTAEAGAVYRFFLGQHVIPFVHATAGGAEIAGPKFQPLTWGYSFSGGGGVDLLLPHTHEHVAFRLAQADYGHMHADQGALQEYDLAGGSQDVNALRLSAGLVFRFGEMNPVQAKSLACDASPADVYAGERVTLAATLRNYRDKTKHPFSFAWELSGGKQQGFGPVIFVDTTGLAAGTYHATAHISLKEKGKQFAQCSTNFSVKPSPAPTLKCSADPSTVTPGQPSTITAYATSIPQRQLTYSYTTSEGQIDGKDTTAQLHTDGLPPGMATVTCRVQDDLGQTAIGTTEVTIAPPALPPAPKAQPLCTVYFNRDMRRPARVDNEGRACLDDIALTMNQQADARLVLVGEHSDSEADGQLTAAERAINTRAYLANEKGIDPSRVDVRTSTTTGRQVQTYLLAPGAVFDQPTEGRIDESKIPIHGQQYVNQRQHAPQKGPAGHGVSHPPKN